VGIYPQQRLKLWVISVGHDPSGEQLSRCSESIDFGKAGTHICVIDGAEEESQVANGWRYIHYRKGRNYAARNITLGISAHQDNMADDDIIALVDLDDKLLPDALGVVQEAYRQSPDILLTYGSYVCASGKPSQFCKQYKSGIEIRKVPWWGSHLKTFKYKLWKRLPLGELLDADGQWIQFAGDLAIMIPLMEIAGLDRCAFIDKPIYWYNDLNPENEHKVDRKGQLEAERWIRSKRPLSRLATI
jgi:hypothetical protein